MLKYIETINFHEYIIEWSYHWCLDIILTTMVSEIFREISAESSPSTAARSSSWKQFSVLYTIPFSGWSPVSIVQDYVHPSLKCTHMHTHTHEHTNNGGHSTDCLLYSPERLATWLLLTFNRVHYGGSAPIQLLLNTGDILLLFLAPLQAFLCSHHPKPFTLCSPVMPPNAVVLFYERSPTCLLSLCLPQRPWFTSQLSSPLSSKDL